MRAYLPLSCALAFTLTASACSSDKEDSKNTGDGGMTASTGGKAATGGESTAMGGDGAATGGTNSSTGGARQTGGTSSSTGGARQTGGASSSTGGTVGAGTGVCGAQKGQLFGADYPFNQRIDSTPLDSESAAIIGYLQQNHTGSARFRIDGPSDEVNNTYGIVLLKADASTMRQSFTQTDDFYSPDCDPAPMPIPANGATEGETGYACENDGDCHLIVVDSAQCRLYEMWRANRVSASSFQGGCLAVWNLSAPYSPTLRGDCCTSADAAGLPIAAHMFTADEIAAGEIPHAIRFTLPNQLMRSRIYVRPATHSTQATSGPASAPPYGARMRLKASFNESSLKPAARVVAVALKRYGMILSDGGNLTFTAANDRFTTAKWADVGLSPGDLTSLTWNDFEVPELGMRYTWDNSCDCQRTPISQ
ncbi:MAG TPA: hypothetical protein VG937_28635 [Polyangiaceae bacterium]|jgi:serine/threonine-protein kinase|nr:hypothetical protein [Polyangiaceae bacterium]